MKKICIALDTTPSAEKVARLGYEYAEALNAEVILVHVVSNAALYNTDYDPIMGYSGFLIQQNLEFTEDLEGESEKFLQATARFLGEPDLETKVLDGEAGTEILEFIKEWNADVLVIGTHSHSVLENVLLGNTAVKIVKHAKIPMLVVPIKKKKS